MLAVYVRKYLRVKSEVGLWALKSFNGAQSPRLCKARSGASPLTSLSGSRLRRVFDFDFCPQTDVRRIQHLPSAFQRDAEVFVAFVSGHLRFLHAEPPGQFPLRDSLRNPQCDEQLQIPCSFSECISHLTRGPGRAIGSGQRLATWNGAASRSSRTQHRIQLHRGRRHLIYNPGGAGSRSGVFDHFECCVHFDKVVKCLVTTKGV